MPNDITSMLGKGKDDQAMSPEEEQQLQSGMGLPNAKDDGEGNPLEKMDKISKEKSKDTGKNGKKFDEDILSQILMTGDNTEGMFSPEEKKEDENGIKLHEEEDKSVKKDLDKEANPSPKYAKALQADILKRPEEYKVMTPKGEMTIAEAYKKGYNPLTGQFDENNYEKFEEEELSKLNDKDRSKLEELMNPQNVGLAPADSERMGLPANNPFIKQPEQQMPQGQPAMPGNPMAMPQGEAGMMPPQGGEAQPDMASLLGGM